MATEDDKFTRLLIASLQGVPLNEVTLPSSSRPMLFTNEAIFFTVADSGDLPCCMLRRDDMLMPDPSVILFQLPGLKVIIIIEIEAYPSIMEIRWL